MAGNGVRIDNKRVRENPTEELITPHGAEIVVTPSRAADLLNRPPIAFGDDVSRKYVRKGESPIVDVHAVTKATPPRIGNRSNTTAEEA